MFITYIPEVPLWSAASGERTRDIVAKCLLRYKAVAYFNWL